MIIKRIDGSYIIEKNGMPYHVPNEGEWTEEWAQINAQALANPSDVQIEEAPPAPTLEELKEVKTKEMWAIGDQMTQAAREKRLSNTDLLLGTAHDQGIKDLAEGKANTVDALTVQAKATMGGRNVEDLVKAYKEHESIGKLFAAVIGGEQDRLTAQIKAADTVEAVNAISWTLTFETAMAKTQEFLAKLGA